MQRVGNSYQVTNLVTNPTSGSPPRTRMPTSRTHGASPSTPPAFVWVADNGTGVSTLYDGSGNANPLVVKIPSANGTDTGTPTGIVFNGRAPTST